MNIDIEILINQYGQGHIDEDRIMLLFNSFDTDSRKLFFEKILFLILQSKPKEEDIEVAILNSRLKSTFTPCVLLRKGIENHHLERLIKLPDDEHTKVFKLLMSLFKIAYRRRFEAEKNNPDKWWYWDLSDKDNIEKLNGIRK